MLSGLQVPASRYLFFLTLPRRNNYIFFVEDPIAPIWCEGGGGGRGFGGNNSSKQRQIELKLWPQVVPMIVQMLFKAFWKTLIFTDNFHGTQSLSFWSNFDLNLPPEDRRNQK